MSTSAGLLRGEPPGLDQLHLGGVAAVTLAAVSPGCSATPAPRQGLGVCATRVFLKLEFIIS